MTLQRRAYSFLPGYLQTNRNNLELAVTDDLLYEPEQATFVSGFIGDTSKLTPEDLARTPRLIENSAIRQKYQFSIGVAQRDPVTGSFVSGAFYDDLLNHLALNGALVDDPNRLFSSIYYAWSPPIDYDKIVNPSRYVWTGGGTATDSGEFITKEAAGTQVVLHQYDGSTLNSFDVTSVASLPGSGTLNEIVEDLSTTDRFFYQWNGFGWARLNFLVSDTTAIQANFFAGSFVYVCRTGPVFNRPVVWVYRPLIGRWVSVPVVVNIERPDVPSLGMVWEDTSTAPSRILRIYDGNEWQLLTTGTIDVFDGSSITYTSGAGPVGVPTVVTYLYDLRDRRTPGAVDSWSALNWWRELADLSAADKAALGSSIQATRPILEFWGNIEPAIGDTRTARNQFPLFNLYAVSTSTYEIAPITTTDFPNLDITPLIATGNYIGAQVVSTIFNYAPGIGTADPVLGFAVDYANDGTPLFDLDLERLPITVDGVDLSGYRFFRDSATQLIHSVWEKATVLLEQAVDTDGLYEVPHNLKSNPDHVLTTEVSRSEYVTHFTDVMKSQVGFAGTGYGTNNYRYSPKDLTLGASMIDPQETLFRAMAVLQTNTLDIPDAIRQMGREYNKVMVKFLNQLNMLWDNGTISNPNDTLSVTADQAIDIILTLIFAGRNAEFPFFNSVMGTFLETRIISGTVYVFDPTPQPIYIPNSAPQIGAAPAYTPQKFTDIDGIDKIRGHDGSLVPAYGDERDNVLLALETRFFDSVPAYLRDETTSFSSRFNNARFHLFDYYGNLVPNLTAGTVTEVVADYNSIGSPTPNERVFSTDTAVFAIWDGAQWLTRDASAGDIFLESSSGDYWIYNGFFTDPIPTYNVPDVSFDYSVPEYRRIIQREFERWVVQHRLDFITNDGFDNGDFFTWNFASAGIEGNFRGIYRRNYHTVRPHSHPWEVVGYSVMPDWWLTTYVPTSYAGDLTPRYVNTHAMWADFQGGIVNPLSGKVVAAYTMVAPIPVDSAGDLLDPVSSGLILEELLTPASIGDDWQYSDGAPIEESFYNSYYYSFAVALAGYLMKPGIFVDRTWSEFYRTIGDTGPNLLWNGPHTVYNTTLSRPEASVVPSQLSLDDNNETVVNPGFNAWIAEYTNLIGQSAHNDFANAIQNCEAALGWKSSGFINQRRTRIELLNGDEVPTEDISVVLHQGPSTAEYFHSGIQIVRDTDGFRVFGTDMLNPVFRAELGAKPISGGQVELLEGFTYDGAFFTWDDDPNATPTKYARNGIVVSTLTVPPITNDTAKFSVLLNGYRLQDKFIQRVNATTFGIDPVIKLTIADRITVTVITTVSAPSTQLGAFTINHVTVTYFQSGTGVYVDYPYGTLFMTLADVVNMMIGYGRWLSSQGWVFERLTNGVLRDWLGAAKNFVKWATDLSLANRADAEAMKGEIFEYSVMGRLAQFSAPFGMVLGLEDIRNGSYGIVDADSQPIRAPNLEITSTGGAITVASDTTDIFGLRLYVSEVQHVVFFPNTTTFNDIIYIPALGLAQDAVFIDTYRTTNWAGRMEAPGFLIFGGRLLPNWEKQVNDSTRLYDRFNPVDDPVLLGMARTLFGYVPKDYMDRLAADDRTRFNFFHGSLKTKGTFQPYRAFIRGTTLGSDNVNICEDWAWKFSRNGDHRIVTVLFNVDEAEFVDVYQAIHFDPAIFSFSFVGDDNTIDFTIPEQFVPEDLVVLVDDVLQVLGADYILTPVDTGYLITFDIPPDANAAIVASVNTNYVQRGQNVYYVAGPTGSSTIETGMALRPNGVLLSLGGAIQQSDTYTTNNTKIEFTGDGTDAYALVIGGLGSDPFYQTLHRGDGFSTNFFTKNTTQTAQTVIVILDGVWQCPGIDYNVSGSPSIVSFAATPGLASNILIIEAVHPNHTRSYHYGVIGDGSTVQYNLPNVTIPTYRNVMVAVDGLVQIGAIPAQTEPFAYTVNAGGVAFNSAPSLGALISIFVLLDVIGDPLPILRDDRVIHIPMFSPPNDDGHWVIPPPQDEFQGRAYTFPTHKDGSLDLSKYIYSAALVDQNGLAPATNLFHWDPAQDIHEPYALANVTYKTAYDPARYNQGPLSEAADGLLWGEAQIGRVWWNTATAIYEDYESFLPDHMRVTREWGKLKYFPSLITRVDETVTVTTLDPKTNAVTAHGLVDDQIVLISGADQPPYNGTFAVTVASASTFTFEVTISADSPATGDIIVQIGQINCYEWVASPVPPPTWASYVESQNDQFNAYTGTVLNIDDPSYATREVWDPNGNATTTYYFWVENNQRVPPGKDISVYDIAGRLRKPSLYEVPYFGILDPNALFVFIGADTVLDGYAVEISYQWLETPRHVEWLLLGEGDDFARAPLLVTDKLIDSLLGEDIRGNPVPNATLAPVDRYGTLNFPAQTVFQNPTDGLTIYIDAVNALLVNIDLSTASDLFNYLVLGGELNNPDADGYWSKTTFWDGEIDNSIIYDTVLTLDELNYRTTLGLYAKDDIVKVLESDQLDLWTPRTFVFESGDIVDGGADYVAADTITFIGGAHTAITELTVTSVDGGGMVLDYVVSDNGDYTIVPPNTIQSLSSGSGLGFTIDATWTPSPIIYAYYQYDGAGWNLVGIQDHTIEINANIIENPDQMREFFRRLMAQLDVLSANKVVFAMMFEMLRQNPVCDWFFKTSYIDLHVKQALPMTAYVRPDMGTLVHDAVLDLKPFRTKLRDYRVTYTVPREDIDVLIQEDLIEKVTLIFDRLACDLNDENAWDTIPWDATATYPETEVIDLFFVGDGLRSCFILPESVPLGDIFVFINGVLVVSNVDYVLDQPGRELCFTTIPPVDTSIEVIIDGPYEYFGSFHYAFQGNGSTNTQIIPDVVSELSVNDVLTTWNGVHQVPVNDFIIQVAGDTEVLYLTTPSSEVEVDGLAFGGVINDVFTTFSFISDGLTVQFSTNIADLSINTVIVFIDGVWQSPTLAFTIDSSIPGNNKVSLASAPASGAVIAIYAVTYPLFIASGAYQFVGDASTTLFAVPKLDGPVIPKVLVNLDGIQQLIDIDYVLTDTGVLFLSAPGADVVVDVFVVSGGIGYRLTPVTSPQTIQWDWAFWDYADLGRKEYDFAGILVGDGTTDTFTLEIPQTSTFLYDVVIKLYLNGVLVTPEDLGLTMTFTKLATSVIVFFSGGAPSNLVYGALYVARGLYEGLEPTFGYQNPQGIVFEPTPASYEHFFARLISPIFDPSTVLVGCPSPEERIETKVDDQFTIIVKTEPEVFFVPPVPQLIGQQVTTSVGSFGFLIETMSGVGLEAMTEIGSFECLIEMSGGGLEAMAEFGDFIVDIVDAPINNEICLPGIKVGDGDDSSFPYWECANFAIPSSNYGMAIIWSRMMVSFDTYEYIGGGLYLDNYFSMRLYDVGNNIIVDVDVSSLFVDTDNLLSNEIVSWDTAAQVIHWMRDGVLLDLTGLVTWYSTNPVAYPPGDTFGFDPYSASSFGPNYGSLFMVWYDHLPSFYDLTITSNVDKIRSNTGQVIDPGANGENITGTSPALYMAGLAVDFVNVGTGGALVNVSGDPVFDAPTTTCDILIAAPEGIAFTIQPDEAEFGGII